MLTKHFQSELFDDSVDVHESTKSHCGKGDNSKKSEGPPQNIQDEGKKVGLQ